MCVCVCVCVCECAPQMLYEQCGPQSFHCVCVLHPSKRYDSSPDSGVALSVCLTLYKSEHKTKAFKGFQTGFGHMRC